MHELSIAMSIVDMAQEEAARHGQARVQTVHLRLGLLSGVVKEALLSSYEMACASTPLQGSQLLIEEIPVEVFCPKCDGPRTVSSIQWFCCPDCGTPTPTVLRGKELEVVALEIQE
jgi:hydrogenase nickel incorporation protein HypA/HybF